MRLPGSRGSWLVATLLLSTVPVIALYACTGTVPVEDADTTKATSEALPAALIDASWPLMLATPADQEKLTGASQGWVALILERQYHGATTQLGKVGGLSAARAHADQSALYRQAAMISAWSFIVTYDESAEPTDPAGTAHLLSVSYALTGDLAKAREFSAKMDAFPTDPATPWHAPWKAWLAQENPVWPPDFSSLPLNLPAPTVGESPDVAFPNYSLPEQGGATTSIETADPGALVALAMWHDEVAHGAAGATGAVVDTYLARYHFVVEPDVAGVDLPFEFLVGSDYLVPADGPFMADLMGAKAGAAVEEWKTRSLLAAIASESRAPDGTFSAELAGNHAANLREQLIAAAKVKNGGEPNPAHQTFADIAKAGTMRSLAFVPEIEVRRRTEESGKLRILAMEMADNKEHTACPAGLLSLAAWDAGNGYTLRGAEILHDAIRRYPSVEASRYALDNLALRRSRQGPALGPQQ